MDRRRLTQYSIRYALELFIGTVTDYIAAQFSTVFDD